VAQFPGAQIEISKCNNNNIEILIINNKWKQRQNNSMSEYRGK